MPIDNEIQFLTAFLSLVSFILGAMVGSFLNVCVCRMPQGLSIVTPRSRCPKCERAIAWYDNIPIVSWLLLGARCRHCGESISWQYPLVEGITATLFFFVFARFGLSPATPVYMVFCASLVLVTFVDLTDWTIPNEVTLPGIPLGILCSVVAMFFPASGLRIEGVYENVFDSLLGVLLGGGIIYLLDKASLLLLKKPGMGFGDVKLLAMLGAFLGWKSVILIIMIASFTGSAVGIATLLAHRPKHKDKNEDAKSEDDGESGAGQSGLPEGHYLPFGPYLALAGIIVLFFGAKIFEAYFSFLRIPVAP